MTQNPYTPPRANVEASSLDPRAPPPAGEPSGIGGWLLLPLLGLIVSPIRVSVMVATDLLPVFDEQIWSRLTTPGSDAYHPLWAPFLIFEVFANIVLIAFAVVLLWFFFRKSYRLPGLFIIWLALHIAVQAADMAFASQVPAAAAAIGESFRNLVQALIGAAIWIPYFRKSVRVRNTFTRGRP